MVTVGNSLELPCVEEVSVIGWILLAGLLLFPHLIKQLLPVDSGSHALSSRFRLRLKFCEEYLIFRCFSFICSICRCFSRSCASASSCTPTVFEQIIQPQGVHRVEVSERECGQPTI